MPLAKREMPIPVPQDEIRIDSKYRKKPDAHDSQKLEIVTTICVQKYENQKIKRDEDPMVNIFTLCNPINILQECFNT